MASSVRYFQPTKSVLHILQILLIITTMVLTAVAMSEGGPNDARIQFGLWASIPTLLILFSYQILIPTLPITRTRLANPHLSIIFDLLGLILYIVAFCLEITWVKDGTRPIRVRKGDQIVKKATPWCHNFKWGGEEKCGLIMKGYAITIVIVILFAITLILSVYALSYFRQTGHLPCNAPTPSSSSPLPLDSTQQDPLHKPTSPTSDPELQSVHASAPASPDAYLPTTTTSATWPPHPQPPVQEVDSRPIQPSYPGQNAPSSHPAVSMPKTPSPPPGSSAQAIPQRGGGIWPPSLQPGPQTGNEGEGAASSPAEEGRREAGASTPPPPPVPPKDGGGGELEDGRAEIGLQASGSLAQREGGGSGRGKRGEDEGQVPGILRAGVRDV